MADMIPSDQYWAWYWTNAYYGLIFGGITVALFAVGALIWGLLSDREDRTERKEHFTRLFD